MKKYSNGVFIGERALYNLKNAYIEDCVFEDGESPLKESRKLNIKNTTFKWKYPIWYSKNIILNDCTLDITARSGIWYTKNITINNSTIDSPKTFRRSSKISLNKVLLNNADETLWNCNNVSINDCYAKGDYLLMNSKNVEINNLKLDGNYLLDGASNAVIRNSYLNSKDSFWNCNNVEVYDSSIIGEYIGWNSKNIKFIRCNISSDQAFCYMENVELIDCTLTDAPLAFERVKNINATLLNDIESVKNPISGSIEANSIKEIILDEKYIDPNKTKIKVKKND